MLIQNSNIEEVVEKIDQINTIDSCFMILIGEKSSIKVDELVDALNAKSITFMGGIFPAVISDQQHYEDAIVIDQIHTKNKPFFVEMTSQALKLEALTITNKGCLLTLVDGLSPNIAYFLDELYKTNGTSVNYLGGGAGSLSLQQMPCLFSNQGLKQDHALMLFIENSAALGVKHGWQELKGPLVATSTEKNTIKQLNWVEAFTAYKETVESDSGAKFNDENFFDIAKAYPFGIQKDYSEVIVRDPLMQENGALICVGEVPQNSVLTILKGEKDSLINAAANATDQAVKKRTSSQTNHCFVFDCISRVLFLEDDFSKELDACQKVLHENQIRTPLLGALTLGEISSFGDGKLEFFNKTFVIGLIQ